MSNQKMFNFLYMIHEYPLASYFWTLPNVGITSHV